MPRRTLSIARPTVISPAGMEHVRLTNVRISRGFALACQPSRSVSAPEKSSPRWPPTTMAIPSARVRFAIVGVAVGRARVPPPQSRRGDRTWRRRRDRRSKDSGSCGSSRRAQSRADRRCGCDLTPQRERLSGAPPSDCAIPKVASWHTRDVSTRVQLLSVVCAFRCDCRGSASSGAWSDD
jgi:hypothetical protein